MIELLCVLNENIKAINMDCRSGQIHQFNNYEQMEKLQRAMEMDEGKRLLSLNDEQLKELKPMSPGDRKNNMRNKACVCGSGKKFKKCCWSQYA